MTRSRYLCRPRSRCSGRKVDGDDPLPFYLEEGARLRGVIDQLLWLRQHWGRAFDVLEVMGPPRAPDGSPQVTHSYISLRKRGIEISKADLERVDERVSLVSWPACRQACSSRGPSWRLSARAPAGGVRVKTCDGGCRC